MSQAPLVRARLAGRPPRIELIREDGVDDDFWYALPLRLGALDSPDGDRQLVIPVERFLAGRLWLRDHCSSYQVGLDLDEPVRRLLRRAQEENRVVRERLEQSHAPPDLEIAMAALSTDGTRFTRQLRDFQQRDLAKLLDLSHGANFSVPGAGKTTVTYALYEAERLRGRFQRLLVVAPLSAFEAWETEAERCFDSPPAVRRFEGSIPWDCEVLLINYQKLKDPYFDQLTAWALEAPTQIVLDEAHRMKRG